MGHSPGDYRKEVTHPLLIRMFQYDLSVSVVVLHYLT